MFSLVSSGQMTKEISIKFASSDYKLGISDSTAKIVATKANVFYLDDEFQPALPYSSISILLPFGSNITDIDIEGSEYIPLGNYKLDGNTASVFGHTDKQKNNIVKYNTEQTYPDNKKIVFHQSILDGYYVLNVALCPFKYEAKTRNLSICSNMKISVKYEGTDIERRNIGHNMRDIVRNMVCNSDELDNMYPLQTLHGLYLIITADSLKDIFVPLLETKIFKGLETFIISKEEIDTTYYGGDLAEKIKRCIKYFYENRGLKYVLLGGDASIIPTRYCYGYASHTQTDSIATDCYFACFDHDITWDGNHNGIFGENDDNCDLDADVFISRLPVLSANDAKGYIEKRIDYELGRLMPENETYNKILFGGKKLADYYPTINTSDAHHWGLNIYNNQIANTYNADFNYLYDTGSNVGETFSASSLQRLLARNNILAFIDTHGEYNEWQTYYVPRTSFYADTEYYTTDSLINLSSKGNTVIVTTACHTNNFTEGNNCLGVAFIKSTNSGTLSYWGSTNFGWCSENGDTKGPSEILAENLFNAMFAYRISDVCEAYSYAKECSCSSEHDWLKKSVNALGDAELCLYIKKPQALGVTAFLSLTDINLTANLDSCNFTLMHFWDNECIYHNIIPDVHDCLFSDAFDDNVRFGIYKSGYKPFISYRDFCKNVYIQNYEIGNLVIKSEKFTIGKNVTNELNAGNVTIENGCSANFEVSKEFVITDNFTCNVGGTLSIIPKQ